jgi:hypothetical protein
MFAEDAIKRVEGGFTMTLKNLFMNIPVGQAPENPVDLLEVSINGTPLTREQKEQVKVSWEDKEFMLPNIMDAGEVPLNVDIVFFMPAEEYNVGDEVTIKAEVPQFGFGFEITRTITE